MVVKRSQAPCSSRWAKSRQCPVVDSKLFSAPSEMLQGSKGVTEPDLPVGGGAQLPSLFLPLLTQMSVFRVTGGGGPRGAWRDGALKM